MATIFGFPKDRVGRARIEAKIKEALEGHEPETRAKKFTAAMETYDTYLGNRVAEVSFQTPEGDPFTDAQIDSIREGLSPVFDAHVEKLRDAVFEIIFLKIAVIDLESC